MCNQNIISNKFDLILTTTLSSYDCHYADRHYAECRYAECRGDIIIIIIILNCHVIYSLG